MAEEREPAEGGSGGGPAAEALRDPGTAHLLESGVDLGEGDVDLAPPPGGGLTQQAARGFLWSMMGFVVLQLGGFATYAVAANILSPDELGIVGKVLTVVFWMDVLMDTGMGAALIHEQEKGQTKRVRIAFTVNTVVAFVVAAVLYLASPALADFFQIPDEVGLFRLLALLALIRGFSQVPDALLRRDLQFGKRSAASVARSITRFGVAVTMLAAGAGPVAMAVSVVVADLVGVLVASWAARFVPAFGWNTRAAVEMLRYGLAFFGARLVGMFWLNGDYLVIGARSSNREYGDYFTAFRLPELVLGSIYNIFSSVAFPTYSAARELGPDKLREASLRSLRLLCLFGFPAGVGMALVARDFITVVFPSHPGAIEPMQLLCLAGAFVAIGYASGDLYNAVGKPQLGLYFSLIGTPILMGGFLLVVDDGIAAVALVHLIVIIPYSAFRIEVANRLIGTTWATSLAALRPAAAAVAGMVALALPLRLVLDAGLLSGVAVAVAGAVGAAVGLLVGDRSTVGELRELAGAVRGG